MGYYDPYVQGYTLRELPETIKKKKARKRKFSTEKFI